MTEHSITRLVAKRVPSALGNYVHATICNGFVFVSGIASRDPETNAIPGLKKDPSGRVIHYDIRAETRATLTHIRTILEQAGSDLDHVLEVNAYLISMADFSAYNEVFREFFPEQLPARTTIAVTGLPGEIHIEMKCIALVRRRGSEA